MQVDICVPVRNEGKILGSNLQKILDYCQGQNWDFSWRIVGIVNGSTDNTLAILQELQKQYPEKIDYLEIQKDGKGGAIKIYWRLSSANVLVFMDADLAVSLDHLEALIKPILKGEKDLVIGSRFLPGAKIERSLGRGLISNGYRLFSRLVLGHNFSDLQCGFKALTKTAFTKVDQFLKDDAWFFDTELVILTDRCGYRILEIPVDWANNRYLKRRSGVNVIRESWQFFKNTLAFRIRLAKLKRYFGDT